MEIEINNEKKLRAEMINRKDGLTAVIDDTTFGNTCDCRKYTATVSKLGDDLAHGLRGFRFSLVKHLDNGHIDLQDVHPTKASGLYGIDTADLMHGVNMLKGFFASNKYRDYVTNHSERAKLIAKKHKLSREISKINHKLD